MKQEPYYMVHYQKQKGYEREDYFEFFESLLDATAFADERKTNPVVVNVQIHKGYVLSEFERTYGEDKWEQII